MLLRSILKNVILLNRVANKKVYQIAVKSTRGRCNDDPQSCVLVGAKNYLREIVNKFY